VRLQGFANQFASASSLEAPHVESLDGVRNSRSCFFWGGGGGVSLLCFSFSGLGALFFRGVSFFFLMLGFFLFAVGGGAGGEIGRKSMQQPFHVARLVRRRSRSQTAGVNQPGIMAFRRFDVTSVKWRLACRSSARDELDGHPPLRSRVATVRLPRVFVGTTG